MRRLGAVLTMALVATAFACGGAQHTGTTAAPAETGNEAETESPPAQTGITPDQLNALNGEFRRRAVSLSNECYSPELGRTGNKKMQGTVSIKLTVEPDGTPKDVSVASSTLNNQNVESCLVSTISGWHLPTVNNELPWSWTYTFEPAY